MPSYIETLLEQRGRSRNDTELAWELREALERKDASGNALAEPERLALQVLAVAHCDGIEDILDANPDSVSAAAGFAASRGLAQTAKLLADAADGSPVAGPVTVSASIGGQVIEKTLPADRWGATDISLSLCDENLDGAILDFVAGHAAAFALEPSPKVARRATLNARIAALAASRSAAELLDDVLAHRHPRVRAQLPEDQREGNDSDWLELAVAHQCNGPADATAIASHRRQHGDAGAALLEVYARHDGAALFIARNEPGFVLVPIVEWPEHRDAMMSWAREVSWQDDPEEIPDWLETAIPFGHTPGDSERWLLVTQGPHAGKVLLSDSDVLDDSPRYASIGEFFAALVLDARRVLGMGGYISYARQAYAGDWGAYYPREYLFDPSH